MKLGRQTTYLSGKVMLWLSGKTKTGWQKGFARLFELRSCPEYIGEGMLYKQECHREEEKAAVGLKKNRGKI